MRVGGEVERDIWRQIYGYRKRYKRIQRDRRIKRKR